MEGNEDFEDMRSSFNLRFSLVVVIEITHSDGLSLPVPENVLGE